MGAHHKFSQVSTKLSPMMDDNWRETIKTFSQGDSVRVAFERSVGGGETEVFHREMEVLAVKEGGIRLGATNGTGGLILTGTGIGRVKKI